MVGTDSDGVFTTIQEVVFDSIDPKLMIKDGIQWYPDVEVPHRNGMGWYVEGLADAYRAIRDAGLEVIDQRNEPALGDEPPTVIGSTSTAPPAISRAGVRLRARTDDSIVTGPATTPGVPWRFSAALTPGDPRG